MGLSPRQAKRTRNLTNIRVHNEIFATQDKHRLRWVFGMWDFFIPERVGGPVKMSVYGVRDANFRTNEVIQQNIKALKRHSGQKPVGVGGALTVLQVL